MLTSIDLRPLAEETGPERAFLSLYLSNQEAMKTLAPRIENLRRLLTSNPVELEYFEENLKLVEHFLEEHSFNSESLAVFACWATDYLKAYPLEKPVSDLAWVDSSPYIRPLAELQDENETYAVVTADNKGSAIYLVTSAKVEQKDSVKGDVKNRVKVGGWSQKRYQRRRSHELQQYAKEICEVLEDLSKKHRLQRVLVLGSAEAIQEVEQHLSTQLAEIVVGAEPADLKDEDSLWSKVTRLLQEEYREEERGLWETIRNEYMRGESAAVGAGNVLEAAQVGRAERILVTEGAKIAGTRCRECENLFAGKLNSCKVCGSKSVFDVDLVNELVELMVLTSGSVEFAEPIEGLTEVGDIAALLRY